MAIGQNYHRFREARWVTKKTKSSTKQHAPTDLILGPEKLLQTGFAQKGLSTSVSSVGLEELESIVCKLFLPSLDDYRR